MANNKICASEVNNNNLFELLSSSTRDYIAARILLLNGLAGQGTILALTCIEKICKVIILKNGGYFLANGKEGHNIVSLRDKIKESNVNYFTSDEELFMKKINDAYKIRYLINSSRNYTIFLPSFIILCHLDKLYLRLIHSTPVSEISPNSKLIDMYLQEHMPRNQLFCRNCYFDKEEEFKLLNEIQWCDLYEDNIGLTAIFRKYEGSKINSQWDKPNDF